MHKGDSHAKRYHRLKVYEKVKALGIQNGAIVTLAGKEAGDIGPLLFLLKARLEDIVFLDKDPIACRATRNKCPKANVVLSDIIKYLEYNDSPKALINLDFTGIWNSYMENAVQIAFSQLVEKGFLMLTFLRGRELEHMPVRHEILSAVKNYKEFSRIDALQIARIVCYAKNIIKSMKKYGTPNFLYIGNYTSTLPMTTFLIRKQSKKDAKPDLGQIRRMAIESLRQFQFYEYGNLLVNKIDSLKKSYSIREIKCMLNLAAI